MQRSTAQRVARPAAAAKAASAMPARPSQHGPRPVGAVVTNRVGLPALLPLACAVHCMITPFLVAFLPAFGVTPAVEWVLLGASMLVAVLALRRGRRFYRNGRIWTLAGVGAAIWALSLLGVFEPLPEEVTSPAGGVVLAVGLFWNGRLSHRNACRGCGCPMH